MTNLTLKKVRKSFGGPEIIKGVDLEIEHGEFVVFVGPSGCGKSTLLRMIAGLEPITSGELSIGGERMNETRAADRGIAMVFQSYALYPHMNVFKNMSFGLETAGVARQEIDKKVRKAADILQISHLLDRKPRELSGGQRQRVAIGRAIVRDPKIFLFDEPLSNLDAELRVRTRVEIAKLHRDIGVTMIYVTHDQVEAMTLADRIVVLRAGIIEQHGTPLDIYNKPANRFVAGFIGSPRMNFVDVTAGANAADSLTVKLAGETIVLPSSDRKIVPDEPLSLGLRPEHIVSGATEGIRIGDMTVEHFEQLGGQTIAYGHLGDKQPLSVIIDGQRHFHDSEVIPVSIAAERCHLFDQRGIRISN